MVNRVDEAYLDLAAKILQTGEVSPNRTGVDTIALFGEQLKFDLREGFPLLTTKKIHAKSIIHELLWMISGDTNIKYLKDNGVRIWNEWADEDGNLGPVYGWSWRKYGEKPDAVPQATPKLRDGLERTYLGIGNGSNSHDLSLKKTWEGMMARCYDKNSPSYGTYGAKGVSVSDEWLEFAVFAKDAIGLPGYSNKINSDSRYVLDKDVRGNGFVYSANNCCWVTDEENSNASQQKLYVVEKDGVEYSFTNISNFCREHGISTKNFSDLWTGNKNAKVRSGFSLVRVDDLQSGFDQLSWAIDQIKNNPSNRRIIVSAWNPSMTELMALPPCHMFFQFNVAGEYLDMQMYQRSADLFLGVPFNITSYALLLTMVAQVCNLRPRHFIHTFGDVHIYSNHLDQINEQISRGNDARELPTLILNNEIKCIDDFTYADIDIHGYDPHPLIKGEVAI